MMHLLKAERLKRNLSQQIVADFTGLSVATIKRAESGKVIRPDARRLLCEYFGKTSEELGLCWEHGRGKEGERDEAVGIVPLPFAGGRLLWTLHLGVESGGLHCVISCPLATGEQWEITLDPEMNGADIQHIYQIVQEHVVMNGIKQQLAKEKDVSSKVVRFGPMAR